jgi:hypothetical protein
MITLSNEVELSEDKNTQHIFRASIFITIRLMMSSLSGIWKNESVTVEISVSSIKSDEIDVPRLFMEPLHSKIAVAESGSTIADFVIEKGLAPLL